MFQIDEGVLSEIGEETVETKCRRVCIGVGVKMLHSLGETRAVQLII